uniref:PD(D/E)XK endonuclease domain-containing protein n=1 Tax=uncultured marine virus TaxID=186617 RepID=A0A0F7L6S6_9VIRU|nr:hypothetical protein [uncultured marine virus]
MRPKSHISGDLAETLAAAHYIQLGYFTFTPLSSSSPIDLIIVNGDGTRLIQIKKDSKRVNPGRSKPARINRKRTDLQKKLGVEMVYVDIGTGTVAETDHNYPSRGKTDTI